MQVLYLHGFASSPTSTKARFLAERLGALGYALHCPDFNQPDFSTLTATRMIEQTEAMLDDLAPGPFAIVGSSLGGFVAWHVAARAERRARGPESIVSHLVLIAPAFDFGMSTLAELDDRAMAQWRETGWHTFEHFGRGEPVAVHYELFADARRHRSDAVSVTAPTLVFQGRHDRSVDADMVLRFAATRPNIRVRILDGDHQLLDHLETMWSEMVSFLNLRRAP